MFFLPSCILKCMKDEKRAISSIAPIKHEMKLMISNNRVKVYSGKVIYFDIDTTHGGCGYDVNYYWLFMKFGYHEISKKDNEDNSIRHIKTYLYYYHLCDPSKINTFYSYVHYCKSSPYGSNNLKRKAKLRKGEY